MTITATIKEAEKSSRMAFNSPFQRWHGVNIQDLAMVQVSKYLFSYADREGNKAEATEKDPNGPEVQIQELKGKTHIDDYEITESSVNGLEIPVGQEVLSNSGKVIFTRTD